MSTTTSPPPATVEGVLTELDALEDPKIRAVNERHGNDIGVNLTKLRAVAKQARAQHHAPRDLAVELWGTGQSAARLVAILISRPKDFSAEELDTMLREAVVPKVHDWLVNYLVKKGPHLEELRQQWMAETDPVVASAGWALTAHQVAKKPEFLDLSALLDTIETQMKDAPERLQWAMNETLAHIGIEHPQHRTRAVEIGESLEVLKDYPTPPNCTSPFAPAWINEMVRRQQK